MKLLIIIFLLVSNAFAYEPAIIPQIEINQGEDFVQYWQLKGCSQYGQYGACTSSLTPVDITGCTFKAYGKKKYTDVNPFINFSTVIFNNHSGMIKLSLSHNQTINFSKLQTGFFDMYIQWPDSSIQYLIETTFITKPTATH